MKITIISVFPELFDSFVQTSLVARAVQQGLISFNFLKLSDVCAVKERIDEPTCGPGAGMIIKPEVVQRAFEYVHERWGNGYKIFFSPQGERLDQHLLMDFAQSIMGKVSAGPEIKSDPVDHIILFCARYEGVDTRVEEHYADRIFSIGDYVLMGGDLPAQVFLEAFFRHIPGIVGNNLSVEHDSFSGPFLDHPEYGLPVDWQGKSIPEIVRSGNHAQVALWREKQACENTMLKRFDWFSRGAAHATSEQIELARSVIPSHYVALLHSHIKLKEADEGNTSIASIDVHDAARACATYGVKNLFVVSALADQQIILNTFLGFWQSGEGAAYNKSRFDAVANVIAVYHLDQVIARIEEVEGKKPLVITTSAASHAHDGLIDFSSQGHVWRHDRPVLFLFGTGRGICDRVVAQSDFLLCPVRGMTAYNHLSVRSAIAIVLDRWLGLHDRIKPLARTIHKNERKI